MPYDSVALAQGESSLETARNYVWTGAAMSSQFNVYCVCMQTHSAAIGPLQVALLNYRVFLRAHTGTRTYVCSEMCLVSFKRFRLVCFYKQSGRIAAFALAHTFR